MSDQEAEAKTRHELAGEISRREWLLKLGGAAFLVGFSGSAPGVDACSRTETSLAASNLPELPPGLYEPSGEHMAHALISQQRFLQIPPGAETDFVRPAQGPFRPIIFTEREFRAIRQLVKLILGSPPKGSAPIGEAEPAQTIEEIAEWIDLVVSQAAAVREVALKLSHEYRALAVAYYGREAVEQLETDDPATVCRIGLNWFDQKSGELRGTAFLELDEPSQLEVARLAALSNSAPDPESAGTKFLAYLHSQVIHGFYTSRAGLNELGYKGNSFSVECPGCKPG